MNLNDLLVYIDDYAKSRGIMPYIVGGAVRDAFLFPNNAPKDVDITTGDKSIYNLVYDLSKKFSGAEFRIFDDRHTSLQFENFSIDFSSNFISKEVERILSKGKDNRKASNIKKEIYSRDFTMNTLLMDLKRTTVYDITEEGVSDINRKVIRCPVDPEITINDDIKRILRAIKYSITLGFEIGEKEQHTIKRNASRVREISSSYMDKLLSDMLDFNESETIKKLYELNVLKYIPINKRLTRVLMNRELARYFR